MAGRPHFLDKSTDTNGLTQVGARYYDAKLGSFISVDPLLDLTDPQQWNGYAYANNNPTTWSDPTGLIIGMIGDWSRSPVSRSPATTPQPAPKPPAPPVEKKSGGFFGWVSRTYSDWLEDSNGESIIVNSMQSYAAGAADAVIGAVDLVTPGTMGRFGNPNSDSIYGYSDDVGEWVGPQILIGGNVGGAAKGAAYAGSLSEKALASAVASLSGRTAASAGTGALAGAAGGVNLALKYKQGWSASQIAAADAKVAALDAAAKAGRLTVTEPVRAGTSAAQRYRSSGGAIPKGSHVDHTIDLQLGGLDDISNMSPLDASVNTSLGAQIGAQLRGVPYGTCVLSVSIC